MWSGYKLQGTPPRYLLLRPLLSKVLEPLKTHHQLRPSVQTHKSVGTFYISLDNNAPSESWPWNLLLPQSLLHLQRRHTVIHSTDLGVRVPAFKFYFCLALNNLLIVSVPQILDCQMSDNHCICHKTTGKMKRTQRILSDICVLVTNITMDTLFVLTRACILLALAYLIQGTRSLHNAHFMWPSKTIHGTESHIRPASYMTWSRSTPRALHPIRQRCSILLHQLLL